MRKKDILELKRRLKKDHCTFTKMCGCYVNAEKHIIMNFRETFLNLEEEEYFKYMEIAKKVLSGAIGNNILELNFPLNEELANEKQTFLAQLKSSELKDDAILNDFYDLIINNYDYTGNFLILLFHDAYDVITKTNDNLKIDESEEVYQYVLCAICPVSLSEPGLKYFEEENEIKARVRDWVVEVPTNGFVFPAFIDRSADVNSLMYYTKNPKDTHPELMENALGCFSRQTAAVQKETFASIIKDTFSADEDEADKIFMEIQDNLNTMIEEYNAAYEDVEPEPIALTNRVIQNLLIESGVPEEITTKIEKTYVESFGSDIPMAESLIDAKVLKAKEQRRKEESLQRQVEVLKTMLDEVKQEAAAANEDNLSAEINEDNEDLEYNKVAPDYDVILQVKPEKIPHIKAQIIDGQKYIVIPINENEQTAVNGQEDLI